MKPHRGRWLWRFAELAVVSLTTCSASAAATHYVATNGPHQTPFTSWTTAATNLIHALAVSADGDTIIVSNGVYRPGATMSITKSITITSLYGSAQTVFDGCGGSFRGLELGWVTATCTVYGITLTNFFGGGFNLEWESSAMTLVNCASTGNRANDGAGMRVRAGILTVSNCTVSGNTATSGGYTGGGIGFLSGYVNGGAVINCEISGNLASSGYGGGIMAGNPVTVQNCTIVNNTCNQSGGGISLVGGATMSNCRIIGNLAWLGWGGGVYRGNVDNCLIACNAATSGIAGGTSGANLRNCTVVSNLANRGGGVYQGQLVNSIVYFNRAQEAGWQATSNCLWGTDSDWTNCNTAPALGVNCIMANPKMVDMPYNCRLLKGSPCINAGTNQSWMNNAVDLGGHVRIVDSTVDMGAYEWFPCGTIFRSQ